MTFRSVLRESLGFLRAPLTMAILCSLGLPVLVGWAYRGYIERVTFGQPPRAWLLYMSLATLFGWPLLVYFVIKRYPHSKACLGVFAAPSVALFLFGTVLSFLQGEPEETLGLWIVLAAGTAALFGTVYFKQRREEALARAEERGWKLTTKEESHLEFDALLLQDMTARQRMGFNLALTAGVVTVLVVFFVMITFDRRYVLGGIFFAVVASVTSYFYAILSREFVKKNQLASELHTARQMQMSLMPREDPQLRGYDIAGVSIPAEEVGGDLYDYFEPAGPTGSVGIALADVSGKAMKAAIATVLVSGMMRGEYRRTSGPSEILASVNRSLKGALESHGFVAMQVLVLDATGKRALYANGGQVFPLLLRGGEVVYLSGTALPLGVSDDTQYVEEVVPLERGDTLLLLSDGITEAMNEQKRMFGFERLESAALATAQDLSARAMADSILSRVRAFAGRAKQHDDMTLVVVKVT